MSRGIFIALHILLFVQCIAVSVIIRNEARKHRVLKRISKGMLKGVGKAVNYIKENGENRRKLEEQIQLEQGRSDDKNLFYRLDAMLIHTQIKRKLPFMQAEILIIVVLLFLTVVFYGAAKISNSYFAALVSVSLIFLFIAMFFKILLILNQYNIEKQLLEFVNLLENYSRTSDDIVSIFGKISFYLKEPLASAVMECYNESFTTGDTTTAFNRLDSKVGHRKFSELLQNLETCSRHGANYADVIKSSRKQIKSYIAERAVRREMVNAARIRIAVLIAIGAFLFKSVDSLLDGKLLLYMTEGVGLIIATAILLILIYGLWQMISMEGEEG